MKVAVVGGGRVGLPSAVGLATLGHEVICCELDAGRLAAIQSGHAPFLDAGLDEALARAQKAGNFTACADISEAAAAGEAAGMAEGGLEVALVAVPVDEKENGLQHLLNVAEGISTHFPGAIMAVKSTVPPGTCANLQRQFGNIHIASNPEFLREGMGYEDFMQPQRIIVGVQSARDGEKMRALYAALPKEMEYIETDCATAELIKLACNTYLSSRVALINELADFCESVGGDVAALAAGMGSDSRVGRDYLRPSAGFGGYCLPKDGRLLIGAADKFALPIPMIRGIYDSNDSRLKQVAARVREATPANPTVVIWGVSFKPGSDSVCQSPGLYIGEELHEGGCTVRVCDPHVSAETVAREMPFAEYHNDAAAALQGADALLILNKSEQFSAVAPAAIAAHTKTVFDYAALVDAEEAAEVGIKLFAVGRQQGPTSPE